MPRVPLPRRREARTQLVEVDAVWPRSRWTHVRFEEASEPARVSASSTDAAAKYRRYRRRLADAVRPS